MKNFKLHIQNGTLSSIMDSCKNHIRLTRSKEHANQLQSFHDYIYFCKAWALDKKEYNAGQLWDECFKELN